MAQPSRWSINDIHLHTPPGTSPAQAPSDAAAPWPVVPGYEILAELGRGNMGVVYKARQTGVARVVALKMIRAGADAGPEEMRRFAAEARAVASFQHPNIVQLYEISLDRSSPFFTMELVEGGTLAGRLAGTPQPARSAAEMSLTLARAIHAAHERGVVHRDLKPANILLAAPRTGSTVKQMALDFGLPAAGHGLGVPKITDFGLAKQIGADIAQTESGMIMGTPCYMAPEQAEGKSREVGPAADIYALGVILYEMLTGRPVHRRVPARDSDDALPGRGRPAHACSRRCRATWRRSA